MPDEILENILQFTPTVRSAFLSSEIQSIVRIVFNQSHGFLMRHVVLPDAQLGFRPCHSTYIVLLNIKYGRHTDPNGGYDQN